MNFCAIDFETATGYRNSACAVAIITVTDGQISDEYYRLIQPPGNQYWGQNIAVHGIRPGDTACAPLFSDIYPHVLGETIERQSADVLIKADLRAFLSKQYVKDGIMQGEIEAVIQKLEAFSSADLYESNKQIMRLVTERFHLKREENRKIAQRIGL